MLAFLPVIGPIIEGIASVFNKVQDTKVVEIQTGAQTTQVETQSSAQIIAATQDDIGLRFMRDLLCFPTVVWAGLIGWDTIVAVRYPNWMFHVPAYPDSVAYLPYAVVVFLLGNIGINMFNRR